MIHQVKVPEEDFKILLEIVEIQVLILEVAAKHPKISDAEIRAGLEPHLGTRRAHSVSKWVTRKPTLLKSLNDFAGEPETEKNDVIVRICHDIELLRSPQQKAFEFFVGDNPDLLIAAAHDFLTYFYEHLGKERGFEEFFFEKPEGESYTRWNFIDGFTQANPSLHLCAICDSTLYRTTPGERPYTSIEHFFPKARYPHLCINPYNLIPICPFCNSGAKGSTNPVDPVNGVLGVVLPYQKSISGLSEQAYVGVVPNPEREKHPLSLTILPSSQFSQAQPLIDNLNRLYKVAARWNSDLDWIDQHMFRRVTQFLMADVQAGNTLESIDFIKERLRLLMAMISKEDLGQDPFGFVTIWLIHYHLVEIEKSQQNDAASEMDTPFVDALRDWAKGKAQWAREYREHAEELIQRVTSIDSPNVVSGA